MRISHSTLLAVAAATTTTISATSLESVCTQSHAKKALPDGVVQGVELDSSSI